MSVREGTPVLRPGQVAPCALAPYPPRNPLTGPRLRCGGKSHLFSRSVTPEGDGTSNMGLYVSYALDCAFLSAFLNDKHQLAAFKDCNQRARRAIPLRDPSYRVRRRSNNERHTGEMA